MSDTTPMFSVCQSTTQRLTFEEDVALYQRLGVQGIEVCEEKLSPDPDKARQQLATVADAGLKVTSVQPQVLSLFPHNMDTPDNPQTPAERMARYRQTIDLFAECFPGEGTSLVIGGGKAPDFDFQLAHQAARTWCPQMADYAAERGVRLMFEPLSPILMNAFTFVTSLDEAMQLIEDVGRENFGLALDVWHVWREPGIAERIAQLGDCIFGVHICDWPAAEPRDLSDRVLPGDGVIDLPPLLGAIERTGYSGAYCLEIYSAEELPDSLWRADPEQVITKGRQGFLDAWRRRH